MKSLAAILSLCICLILFNGQPVCAGEIDVLIKKLVEKGILTKTEATDLLKEIQKEAAKEKDEIKKAETAATDIPNWVKNTKFKGDVRVRYQEEDRDNDPVPSRSRGRLRLRLGVETRVNEQWKAGFGLATGGSDPRSTNQTLENTFDSPDIRLDYAFAEYQPFDWGSAVAGKFKNPLWRAKDLLWDGDIRPEGVAVKIKHNPGKNLEFWATPGFFILENITGAADPNLVLLQAGVKYDIMDNAYVKFASSIYEFNQVKGHDFTAGGAFGRGTNSEDVNGNWLFDHDAWALDAEVGVAISGPIPFVAVFGEFVQSDVENNAGGTPSRYGEDDDTGYLLGFKFGHKKINEFGKWEAKYNYRRLENDAWPDWLPDSDFLGGRTNVKGHEYEFRFGINKNVTLGIDYYESEPIRTTPVGFGGGLTEQTEKIFQGDLLLWW